MSFIEQAAARDVPGAPSWADSLRESGRKIWQSHTLPTRKTEAWKYTPLRALERGEYLRPPTQPSTEGLDECIGIAGLDACRLVFVNGVFAPDLSDAADVPGMQLVRFSDATPDETQLLKAHLGTLINRDQHLFAALNDSWMADGVFVRIDDNADVQRPLHVVWLTRPDDAGFSVSQRLFVAAGKQSRATVIEHFVSTDETQNVFTNGVTELAVGDGAHLNHYRLHLEERHALHIGGVHARLQANAVLNTFYLALGGALKRIDAVVEHVGSGAHCEMNGIYLPRHDDIVDFHTTIEHAVPQCTTNETFRGIVGDKARAVFNGRIHIHPDAQKTNAQLSNKNLLTSPNAEVDTKPELEIYADDVQCAHGATVSQLEEESLFYFLSRGIGREEAGVMLNFGFINELVDRIKLQPIHDHARAQIAALFGRQA